MLRQLLWTTHLALLLLLSTSASATDPPPVTEVYFSDSRKAVLCPDKGLSAERGFTRYRWFAGPDATVVDADADGTLSIGGTPLLELENPKCPNGKDRDGDDGKQCRKLPRKQIDVHPVIYLSKIHGDLKTYQKFEITQAKAPKVRIEANPDGSVEREHELKLKTTEAFEEYKWTFLGHYLREDQAAERYKSNQRKKWADKKGGPGKKDFDLLTAAAVKCWAPRSDGTLAECQNPVWPTSGGKRRREDKEQLYVRATSRGNVVEVSLSDDPKAREVSHFPRFNYSVYSVVVKDKNGCTGSAFYIADVDQHRFDFTGGVDFARLSSADDRTTNGEDEEQGSLFENSAGFAGIQVEHYFRNFTVFTGHARFGGADIAASNSTGNLPDTLTQADAFQLDLGIFHDFGCGFSTQICGYVKFEWGFFWPENGGDDDSDEMIVDDVFERSFLGLGWRYHRPGNIFHRSFAEIGFGKSDNLESDGSDRLKLRTQLLFDLAKTWDLFISGELDVDRGDEADDLRVLIGVRRDLSFIGDIVVNALGFGEEK